MKTPIDSASAGAGATVALLNGTADFQRTDLWAITLSGGSVIRWHSAGFNTPLSFTHFGSQSAVADGSYLAGPLIDRGKISSKLGLEVATLDIVFSATLTDLINGVPLIPFVLGNGFDGAVVTLWRAFLPAWGQPISGVINQFTGRVTQIKDLSGSQFTMTVSGEPVLLNVNMGPDVYQAPCLNTLFNPACTLVKSSFATSGAVVGSGGTTGGCNSNLTQADGYFTQGEIDWITGPNAGLRRSITTYLNASGAMTFAFPLPFAPQAGDTFTAYAGCDLTMATCKNKFSNLINFRGTPFVPAAINGITGLPGN